MFRPDRLIEVDTVINMYYDWAIGAQAGKYDVQSVMMHEFGHWLVLQHLYEGSHSQGGCDEFTGSVMYYSIGANTTRRNLTWIDLWGKWYLYASGWFSLAPPAVILPEDYPLEGGLYGKNADLLPPFPAPANPELWLPYRLFRESPVQIRIYDVRGTLVRTLDLGLKPAGNYLTKEKAAYWDGRNETSERVATGVYFYTLETKSESLAGRIVIGK